MSGDDLFGSAKLWEESRDWTRAIDTYLEIKKEHFPDGTLCEDAWERAVDIARNYAKDRYQDIARIVSKRLRELGKFEQAAHHYENIGTYDEAVACYV
jgi:intraflagellar transport protein 172